MKDYRVKTKVELSTGFPEGEFNLLIFEKTKKQMTEKIADIIKGNDLLSYYIEGDLSFHFCDYKICLEYIFTCHASCTFIFFYYIFCLHTFTFYCNDVSKKFLTFNFSVFNISCAFE